MASCSNQPKDPLNPTGVILCEKPYSTSMDQADLTIVSVNLPDTQSSEGSSVQSLSLLGKAISECESSTVAQDLHFEGIQGSSLDGRIDKDRFHFDSQEVESTLPPQRASIPDLRITWAHSPASSSRVIQRDLAPRSSNKVPSMIPSDHQVNQIKVNTETLKIMSSSNSVLPMTLKTMIEITLLNIVTLLLT
jgi:hypothetical protein